MDPDFKMWILIWIQTILVDQDQDLNPIWIQVITMDRVFIHDQATFFKFENPSTGFNLKDLSYIDFMLRKPKWNWNDENSSSFISYSIKHNIT